MRLLEPLGEIANSKTTSQFRLWVNPISQMLYIIKNVPPFIHGKSSILTDSNKKFNWEGNFFDTMANYKCTAMSIDEPKDKNLLLDFLDEMKFDFKHTLY